jgi:hypothetical protein
VKGTLKSPYPEVNPLLPPGSGRERALVLYRQNLEFLKVILAADAAD